MIKRTTFNFLFSFLFLSVFLAGCNGKVPVGGNTSSGSADVTIRVIDKKLQQPVVNARVSLTKDNNPVGSDQVTNSQGEAVFKGVAEDDGYIAFINNATGYKSTASPVIKVIAPTTESNVLIDRIGDGEGTGLIAGSVKDRQTKQPVVKLTVTYSGPKITKSINTDENGSFVIEGLVAGNYVLTFSKAGYTKIQKQITVQDGKSSNIETIYLTRATTLTSTGNYLVSLSGAKKVVELSKEGTVVWSYSQLGSIESAARINTGDTVISDGSSSKVVQVSGNGSVVKSMGSSTIFSSLKYPSWVDSVDGSTFLVTDNEANKVIEFNNGKANWTYNTGLNRPRSAVYLNNGDILITDTGNRRVIEVNKSGNIVWTFDQHMDKPVHAIKMANGNYLVTDSGYSRILEVDYKGTVVWWFAGPTGADVSGGNNTNGTDLVVPSSTFKTKDVEAPVSAPGNTLLFPRSAVKLDNGNILIADTGNNRIVEVSPAKAVVWELDNLSRPVSAERL